MRAIELVENSKEQFNYVWFLRPDIIFNKPLPHFTINYILYNILIII